MRVAINGFGRIGRIFFRIASDYKDLEIVAINDLTDTRTLAHLLKYDTNHGIFQKEVGFDESNIIVNGKKIKVFAKKDPAELTWKELDIDVVLESTGIFLTKELAQKHLQAGAKKVLLSAPPKDKSIPTVVLGVNSDSFDFKNNEIVSNASCTTNCIGPVIRVLHDNFGVTKGFMTTVHSYTNDQRILDLPHKDLRRARAAAMNMIPTTTGATRAIGIVIPELNGKLDGISIRVPTSNVSLIDFVCNVENVPTIEQVNEKFKKASQTNLKGILEYTQEPLVSHDLNGNPHSSIFDGTMTHIIDDMVKVFAWYDNEFGYSSRLKDVMLKMI
ncbi:NAD-dependent glyceraldehyde-3-phosphate dehydrogenase [Desulfurella amilsii]|uniref:Glyceraldehyde-3-phosphate dehydrogenase n=1 Tax=Desulfurella amilsii TaxID=1562698 RepID=A0A1X4XYP8_9BACT|nr:type I glyceraldehyde-3-phosphate dehydrogenase [Desulfurella amilsii]OSS42671.1 NAD-dependent glyceraldehyde-3-phosphate dehydrogenase [Desulfurella amilsii]